MGMYTQLHLAVQLKKSAPAEVTDLLAIMVSNDAATPESLPDAALFSAPRWRYMLVMDSYYFDADTYSSLRHDEISHSFFLFVQTNLKNYDDEIGLFLDWLMPHIETEGFIGYTRYEEDEEPTLLYANRVLA